MSGDLNEQLAEALVELEAQRALVQTVRTEHEGLSRRLEDALREVGAVELRMSAWLALDLALVSRLNTIVSAAEASGSYAEIAEQGHMALDLLAETRAKDGR